MDDYETCDSVLGALLARATAAAPADKLVMAALLQQRSLRLRDSGRPHAESSIEALRLLDDIALHACPEFKLSPGVSASYTDTLARIVTALRQAAWSLLPLSEYEEEPTLGIVPNWQDRVREPVAEQLLRVDRTRAATYANFLEGIYSQMFRSQAWTLGGRAEPDLFPAVLALELLGHVRVYQARKELALMRLVQAEARLESVALGDALRLLRHSGAMTELDLAVERLRAAGPLSALSEDARQILLQRRERRLLRTVELRVLRAAAELMTEGEASGALEVVLNVITAGGPLDIPGQWQLEVIRLEAAWLTAAALANAAGEPGRVAELLLDAVLAPTPPDELWDRSIGRALRQLDWENVPEGATVSWGRWLRDGADSMPVTAEVVEALSGARPPERYGPVSNLDDVAKRLNASIRGEPLEPGVATDAASMTRQALSRIRESAAGGAYSFGGGVAADVAVALIVQADVGSLWADLAEFLTDGAVHWDDRSAAFERLAWERPPLPAAVAERFRRDAPKLVLAPAPIDLSGKGFVPYPAALRFLACCELINEFDAFEFIARLAGSAEPSAREQAARTVAAVAAVRADTWLLALATQLSHDAEVAVKAHAGRALALLASARVELQAVASTRLVELLGEDGVLVPLLILREFGGEFSLPESVMGEIERLQVAHPSRLVRKQAALLVAHDG
jgi:hypothetical protein